MTDLRDDAHRVMKKNSPIAVLNGFHGESGGALVEYSGVPCMAAGGPFQGVSFGKRRRAVWQLVGLEESRGNVMGEGGFLGF